MNPSLLIFIFDSDWSGMAHKLKTWPDDKVPKRKYPWDRWFDGHIWKLKKGEDYDCPTRNIQVQILIRAKK